LKGNNFPLVERRFPGWQATFGKLGVLPANLAAKSGRPDI
jgi:hypothetical protein